MSKNKYSRPRHPSQHLNTYRSATRAFLTAICLMLVFSIAIIASSANAKENIPVDEGRLLAKHVLVKNISTGEIIYAKNHTAIVPIASLTKIMTAITAEELYRNSIFLPKTIKLDKTGSALTKSDRTLITGGYMRTPDLVSYMLLSSSNFAAESLSKNIIPQSSFISYMNFLAKKFNLTGASFTNPTGLTDKNGSTPTASSEHIMTLLDTLAKEYPNLTIPSRYNQAIVKSSTGKEISVENTNQKLSEINQVYFSKTGYTDEAGGNLALIVKRKNNFYGIVILQSTQDGRFDDAIYLTSLLEK